MKNSPVLKLYLAYLELGLEPNRLIAMSSWSVSRHCGNHSLHSLTTLERIKYLRKFLGKKKLSNEQIVKMITKNYIELVKGFPEDARQMFLERLR